jgi:hypothetical protein
MVAHPLSRIHLLALLGGVALTACVNVREPSTRPGPLSNASSVGILQDEIARSHAATVYDAIQLTRPVFLVSQSDLAPLAERQVYLDGMLLGGIDELRRIPASSVREIRFVRTLDVGSGMGHRGGAILVITKVGR